MLKTKVILSEVTNLSDARYASGMGVDFIGFSINPISNTYLPDDKINEISNWLSGVEIIGDMAESIPENVEQESYSLIQTSNEALLSSFDRPILELDADKMSLTEIEASLEEYTSDVAFFILKISEDQIKNNLVQLKEILSGRKVFISTEFNESNINLILEELKPEGIVLYGSTETKPGLSSYDGIADILELIEDI